MSAAGPGGAEEPTDHGDRAAPGDANRAALGDGNREPLDYGDAWVYESIFGALPGLSVSPRVAVLGQFALFETAVVLGALVFGLPQALVPGTVAVGLAAAGSVAMIQIGRHARSSGVPPAYRRALFGSNIEVVLGLMAFVILVTYLFVVDPRGPGETLLARLLGPEPPAVAVVVFLLICWDVCYRIGTGWWASVVSLWGALRLEYPADTRRRLVRAYLGTMAFAVLQLSLLPFLIGDPFLAVAVAGHVVAVGIVTAAAIGLVRRQQPNAV